jgi:hypothetical protein
MSKNFNFNEKKTNFYLYILSGAIGLLFICNALLQTSLIRVFLPLLIIIFCLQKKNKKSIIKNLYLYEI